MTHTKCNGLAAANNQPAETHAPNTNDLDFATGTRHSKAESTLSAVMAMSGYAVYPLKDGDYLVCKYGMTHHEADFAGLEAFAKRLGFIT